MDYLLETAKKIGPIFTVIGTVATVIGVAIRSWFDRQRAAEQTDVRRQAKTDYAQHLLREILSSEHSAKAIPSRTYIAETLGGVFEKAKIHGGGKGTDEDVNDVLRMVAADIERSPGADAVEDRRVLATAVINRVLVPSTSPTPITPPWSVRLQFVLDYMMVDVVGTTITVAAIVIRLAGGGANNLLWTVAVFASFIATISAVFGGVPMISGAGASSKLTFAPGPHRLLRFVGVGLAAMWWGAVVFGKMPGLMDDPVSQAISIGTTYLMLGLSPLVLVLVLAGFGRIEEEKK